MTNTTKPLPPQPSSSKSPIDYSRIFESKIFWLALVTLLFSLPLYLSFVRPQLLDQPVLGNMGNFELINQEGRKFSNRDVQGSVLLVNFVFTRCQDVCSTLTRKMSDVQARLKGTGKSIQLVTVSVDPEFDNPAVLKDYAVKNNADLSTWSFLTGPKEDVRKFVVGNFASPIGVEKSKDLAAGYEIAHGEHFVIVDQVGRIRSYEHITGSDDVNAVLKKLAILVNTPPRS